MVQPLALENTCAASARNCAMVSAFSRYTMGEPSHSSSVGFDSRIRPNALRRSQPFTSRSPLIGSSITSRPGSTVRYHGSRFT